QKAVTPFDLSRAPLFKVTVIESGNHAGLLIFHFHHTIADGISMNIFVQEIIQLLKGQKLPPVKYQYRDYQEWENAYHNTKEIEEDKKYWLDKLHDAKKVLQLPQDFSPSKENDFSIATLKERMSADAVKRLRKAAGRHQCSLFMLLITAFNILLKKLSGNEDIIIGAPSSNRGEGLFDNSIGMFTNTAIWRNSLMDHKSLKELVIDVKQSSMESYPHLYYPYHNLLNDLSEDSSLMDTLVNTMFIYEKTDQRSLKIDDVEISTYDFETQFSEIISTNFHIVNFQ